MKKLILPFFLLIVTLSVSVTRVKAQSATDDAGTYMAAITNAETDMNRTYMAYVSTAAHSSRKRKIERLRVQTVVSITDCRYKITELPLYKGDNSFRQSSLNYVLLCYKVFNEDYAHIVNMEDIAEQSYDAMQAYLLLQEATNDTLKVAMARMAKAQQDFAAKYNIKLVDQKTELDDKMDAADKLSKYHDKVYLLFFKCSWEDEQLTGAVNKKSITAIEQARNALDKYALEGMAALDTLRAFESDPSLSVACKQALAFYKKEAETQMPQVTDFFLKEENFDKIKKAMDAKGDSRTQQDVDTYNKAVNDMNAGADKYNQVNADLNNGRSQVIKNWNDTDKSFLDTHTPYYKG